MRVCVHLEFKHFLGGIAYKKLGSGMLSSYRNQLDMMKKIGFNYTEKWDDSCDILMANLPWLATAWLIKKAHRKGKKVIVWSHMTAEDMVSVFWFNKYIVTPVKWYLKKFYNSGDIIFSPSAYTKRLLVNYGINPEKIIVMSNGVNLENFFPDDQKRKEAREKYNLKKITVGSVGLAIPRKGIDTFLYLAKKFPEIDFIWYGKIYSSLLVKADYKTDLPNVKFTGFVEDNELNAAFNSLDIFIFPSYEENQGMVLMEAAAVGLPILVRDLPVYEDWLTDKNCCLTAKNNEEFEEKLKELISSEELRMKLSQEIKKVADENSLETLEIKFKKILEDLK
jgi:1,2-diacylglycerol-3-alpha-glucose alpha-1,2-glucosyltransferase